METLKPCACGCGTPISPIGKRGLPVSFAWGHGARSVYESERACRDCNQTFPIEEFAKGQSFTRRCKSCTNLMKAASKYGITAKEYLDLRAQSQCQICGGAAAHIDHDHSSGAIRGMLCERCNLGLGHFNDEPDRLIAAAAYLLQSVSLLTEQG